MTERFSAEFPTLWEGFEARLKRRYTEALAEEPYMRAVVSGTADRHPKAVHTLYKDVAFGYWDRGGDGEGWMKEFEKTFFGNRFRPYWEKFFFYFKLDELVIERAKTVPGGAAAFLTPPLSQERLEEFYRLTLKPHVDVRRREIQNDLEELKRQLKLPVPYTLRLPLEGETRKLALTFRSERQQEHQIGVPLEGCTYSYNGRSYRDVDSLLAEETGKLAPDVFLGVDAYGEGVLVTRRWVPTFDSADREWDSQVREYLFFDGTHHHLVVMRGGYHISSLTFYETLLSADSRLKPIFEKLGWPLTHVTWTGSAEPAADS